MYYLRPPATLVRFVTANFCSWLMRGLHLLSALFLAAGPLPMISLPPSAVPFSDEHSQPQAQSDLLQFSHAGHIFGFKSGSFYLSNASYALHVDFIGANPVKPSSSNHLNAEPHPAPPLNQVSYEDLWDGISLTYETVENGLVRSTWSIEPGADPAAIRLAYNAPVTLNADGSLSLAYETGTISESAPLAWQEVAGQAIPVEVAFQLSGVDPQNAPSIESSDKGSNTQVGFTLGDFDPTRPLFIDPTLSWNTFLGQRPDMDRGYSIAIDDNDNIYVAGYSAGTWGTPLRAYSGGDDAFVARLDPNGQLVWHTFIGGRQSDEVSAVALDDEGNVYVAGNSDASWGTPLRSHSGSADAFVARLDPNGQLVWHTFVGGSQSDEVSAVTVDNDGKIYLAGTSNAAWGTPLRAYSGNNDAFIAQLDTGGNLTWHTFLGGSGTDYGSGIAVDGSGDIYVTGFSNATWGTPLRAYSSGRDAFAARLGSSGSLMWHTFLGGSSDDQGLAIAVDSNSNIYITGYSSRTWGTPLRAFSGSLDAFAARLTSAGSLVWHTFLGGSGTDYGHAITAAGNGNIYIVGISNATWLTPIQPFSGGIETFVVCLNNSGSLTWHTFLGSSGDDYGWAVTTNTDNNIYTVGYSPTSWATPVQAYTGGQDAFVAGLDGSGNLIWNTFLGGAGGNGNDYGRAMAVDDNGNIYIAGESYGSWGTPVRPYGGGHDVFVARLDSASGHLTWHTFLGGSGSVDSASAITVDSNGHVYILGESTAAWGEPMRAYSAGNDVFIAQLEGTTGTLTWHTFLGGSGADYANGLAVDNSGSLYGTGSSNATWGTPMGTYSGNGDVFLVRLDADSGNLVWQIFLGSAEADYGGAIAVDDYSNLYLVGYSEAAWGVPIRAYSKLNDAFVAQLTSSGSLTWLTFLGGNGGDSGKDIALDSQRNVYVVGTTYATSASIATWGTPLRAYTGQHDAYAAKLDCNGNLVWHTFLGDHGDDSGYGITVDRNERVYVTGVSSSSWGTPVQNFSGGSDALVVRLEDNGSLTWHTFVGGSGGDTGSAIAVDKNGNIAITGNSGVPWGTPVRDFSGGTDAFVAQLDDRSPYLNLTKMVNPTTAQPGQTLTYTLTFSNTGSAPATTVVVSDTLPLNLTPVRFSYSGAVITDTGANPAYTWNVQDLAPGQGGIITVTGQLSPGLSGGIYTNSATISGVGNYISVSPPASAGVTIIVGSSEWRAIYLPLILKNTISP